MCCPLASAPPPPHPVGLPAVLPGHASRTHSEVEQLWISVFVHRRRRLGVRLRRVRYQVIHHAGAVVGRPDGNWYVVVDKTIPRGTHRRAARIRPRPRIRGRVAPTSVGSIAAVARREAGVPRGRLSTP